MSVTIKIEGTDELKAALLNMSDDIRREVGKVVQKTGINLRGDIIKRYQRGPATGRIYRRGGITHQASAPGEAPMSDTGRLAGGVLYSTTSDLSITVFHNEMRAVWLEYGTRHIRERPAWTPAAIKAQEQFDKDIRRVVLGETK